MSKIKIISLNFILLTLLAVSLIYLPILNLGSFSLFLMGIGWVYLFHKETSIEDENKKPNRLSFFWFIQNSQNLLSKIPNVFFKDLILILLPFLIILGINHLIGSSQVLWPFLVGAIIYELVFLIRKLIYPSKESK